MLVEDRVKKYLEKIKEEDEKINSFLNLNENAISDARRIDEKVKNSGKKGRLYGYVFGIKSAINVKGMICSAASKVLENYKATYDATVIEKIREEDGVIIGMTNCDEFCAGCSGENSAFGPTANPLDIERVAGGSSSGSAAAVAAGFCDVALGSDTGGSIRNPSSFCGVVGVKPSYGLVSRYGLMDLAMSLDQIGPITKNVEDAALVLDVIKGKDERDSISFDSEKIEIKEINHLKIGVIDIMNIDERIISLIRKRLSEIKEKFKWDVINIKLNYIDLAVQTYYLLVYAEFFSATRRYDGRRFGRKIEDFAGEEVLRRIFGGSEITKAEFKGQYYQKALAVKEIIKKEFEESFKKVDCIIIPTCPKLPWKIGEKANFSLEEIYAFDALTIPANLAEICAISIPIGKVENIPIGMQIMCGKKEESKMFSISKKVEDFISKEN